MDKEIIVHDLALIYAKERFHELYQALPGDKRIFPHGISDLVDVYCAAVTMVANHADQISDAYLDLSMTDARKE